jgi:hypothetical protein
MNLKIEYLSPSDLKAYENNSRTHSETQVEQICNSIREFGFVNPILISDDNVVIAGHGRLMAANEMGLDTVPVIRLSDLSDRQRRALVIADNKIAMNAGWDFSKLGDELSALVGEDFDLGLTGFNEQELDALLKDDIGILPDVWGQPETVTVQQHQRRVEHVSNGLRSDDEAPAPAQAPVSQRGDVWVLGDHRLMCGDSTNPEDVTVLMVGKKADMVFTDPPYNVKISKLGVGGNEGSIGSLHGEFVMASGEMNENEFTDFLKKVFSNLVSNSKDGAIHYVCMDWRHMQEVITASETYATVGGGEIVTPQATDCLE